MVSHRQEISPLVVECQTPLPKNLGANIGLTIIPTGIMNHVSLRLGVAHEINLVVMVIEEKLVLLIITQGAGGITT